jgi:glycine dehydrogenase subunit 2
LQRDALDLPEVSEIDVIRHFTRLSHLNHAIDIDFYPLGSCTMKYNPKINEMSKLPVSDRFTRSRIPRRFREPWS